MPLTPASIFFNKVLVSGHIYHAHLQSTRQIQPGETQLDSHFAQLLLGQAVGVNPCQGFNKSRLAVVDMTGCPYYEQNRLSSTMVQDVNKRFNQ
jgi:hypothetical protein